jgi:hypothetical protein
MQRVARHPTAGLRFFRAGASCILSARELFPLPVDHVGYNPFEAAPNGRRFLVRAYRQQAAQALTLIVN